jgi:hypothetical protein
MLPPLSSSGFRGYLDTTTVAAAGETVNDNPYRVPSDDQVLFQMREEERRMHQQSRARNQSMRVWEKSRKEVLSFSERLREIVGRLVSWW